MFTKNGPDIIPDILITAACVSNKMLPPPKNPIKADSFFFAEKKNHPYAVENTFKVKSESFLGSFLSLFNSTFP